MHLNPFRIEQYYAKYEFTARYMLSSSDAESRSLRDLLALEDGAQERLLDTWLGYTESPGASWLREEIAHIYEHVTAEDVLVCSSAEEGIFVLYHALLGPGDHVVVETPCFESGLELARSTGAQVSEWRRRPEDGWAHDLAALKTLIQPNTKVLYITTPHNPTGLLMERAVFDEVMTLARGHGLTVLCDEVYRELEHDPAARLPAACDAYEHAVSLGSMSKTYGLAGLRLGWHATRDREVLRRCLEFKLYTTICNSAPSEFLTALALRHREQIVARNLDIVRANLPLLDAFFARQGQLFSWTRPNAASLGFARFMGQEDPLSFCGRVVQDTGVLLLPGTVYDVPDHVRFGFGRANLPEALGHLEAYLNASSGQQG
ncbi:aminotransferase class I/II-fold pyridoxal phosphate-dependent enzyme [Deinococcus oregonensis]|uniref:Aminotransferase n=1 Tax=Deinococcus oregonensis TaxID=1805970 RepID=A0ABV6B8Q1_9DEIO